MLACPITSGAADSTQEQRSLAVVEVLATSSENPTPVPAGPTTSGLDGAPHAQPLTLISRSRGQLEADGARELSQALETVSAVSIPSAFQIQVAGAYGLRGFDAAVLQDGFHSLTQAGDRDALIGIDRIDFVKGPGSALNSGGLGLPPGGAIDIHSAWAGTSRRMLLQQAASRYDQEVTSIELDSGDLAPVISLAAGYERAESEGFYDFSRLDREKKRVSLSLRQWNSRLSFYAEESERGQKDHPGLPTTGTLDRNRLDIPDSRSVMDPDVPLSTTGARTAGADWDISLGRHFSLTGGARRMDSEIHQFGQYLSSNQPDFPLDPNQQTWNRNAGDYHQVTRQDQARVRLTARLESNTWGDYTAWVGSGREEAQDAARIGIGIANPVNLVNPSYGSWGLGAFLPFSQAMSEFDIRNLSRGLQWRWRDRINLFYSQTDSRARINNNQTLVDDQYLASLGLPQLLIDLLLGLQNNPLLTGTGLVTQREDEYDLTARQYGISAKLWDLGSSRASDGLWLFYGEGNGHLFQAYYTGGSSPEPELSEQREAGLRLIHGAWGSLQAAIFEIERRNVRTRDPDGVTGFETITTGLQSVKGGDLDLLLRPPYPAWDRFSIAASLALLSSRIDEDNTFPSGNALVNVPRRQWRLQVGADLLRGPVPLSVFAAQRCRSEVAGDLNNSFIVPERCLFDAGATVRWRGLSLDAVIRNLSDKTYYEPYTYLFNGVIPGEGRTARLTLRYLFDSRQSTGGIAP